MILSIAFSSLRITAIYFNRIAIILLLYSGVLAYNTLNEGLVGSGVGVFGGLFQVTTLTQIGALVLLLGENSTLISKVLVSMFLSIELQSFAVYILATIYKESESATSAGLNYFLLGSSLLYGFTGLTNFDGFYMLCSTSSTNHFIEVGVLLMAIGLLFKISAAPFHFPFPSIYDGVPTIVTALLSNLPKISLLILLLGLAQIFQDSARINTIFLITGLLSLILGSITALSQSRIKKILAYSSISNVGFLLLALSTNSEAGLESFFFYLIQYTLSTGIPPLIGFFAKFMVLFSILSSGSYFVAVIVILFSVVSASYYLRLIRTIHFDSFILALLVINNLISINKPYAEKVSPYECGYSPVGDARVYELSVGALKFHQTPNKSHRSKTPPQHTTIKISINLKTQLTIVPPLRGPEGIKVYANSDTQKSSILSENRKKAGRG
ncbi:various chains-domain-containing protein [Endogone sp. FLAS-F59071]|nr:various chains-domain-containing protein [Endogone sp. FLAS-F59071]|eukprot:RUS23406.1 various chains-domain-containing protein [Endogone sp. FLAS-F59071]